MLVFEVLLNATAMFNHANVRLPRALDRLLRWLVVTPDMHRVHHSIVHDESSSNFGFNLPWWDRLFGTYRAQPAAGHERMTIGVDAFRSPEELASRPSPGTTVSRHAGRLPDQPAPEARLNARAWLPRVGPSGGRRWPRRSGRCSFQDQLEPAALEARSRPREAGRRSAFVASFALATVLFLPGSVFGLAGGALFGPVWGTVWNLTGATLGATFAFLIARYVASDWVARRAAGRLKQLIEGVEAEGWRFVALTRLVPLVPFNLLNYALGLTRIRLADYAIATLVCMAPGAAAYAWLGYAGREAAAGNRQALSYGLLGLALLAVVIFVPRLVRRMSSGPSGWISTAELRGRLDAGVALTVVDVRGPDEFDRAARAHPRRTQPAAERARRRTGRARRGGERPIVLVCRTDKRSATAAEILRNAGFRDVLILRGGMEQWQRDAACAEPIGTEGVHP